MIRWIRHRHNVSQPSIKRPDELPVKEICEKFEVSIHVVYYWIEHGIVSARRRTAGSAWLVDLNAAKEAELRQWVKRSPRLHNGNTQTTLNS